MRSNIQVSTIPTLHFLVSIQRWHLRMGEIFSLNIQGMELGTYQSGRFKISQRKTLNFYTYFELLKIFEIYFK